MVTPVPARFRASDGVEFATQQEAIDHEGLLEASCAYMKACRELQIAIGEKQMTADGHPFHLDKNHWAVIRDGVFPTISEVTINRWSFQLDPEDYQACKVKVHREQDLKIMMVGDLYRYKNNAIDWALQLTHSLMKDLEETERSLRKQFDLN